MTSACGRAPPGRKSTGCSQDLVGPPQLLVLALQRLEPSGILAGRPRPL